MLAVIVGLRAEHVAIDQNLEVLEQTELADGYLITQGSYNNKPVLTCRTGLGRDRVCAILPELLSKYPISAIVSARMARGVSHDLKVGDLAFCPKTALRVEGSPLAPKQESDMRLLEIAGFAAQKASIAHMVGDCQTVWPLPRPPIERKLLAQDPKLAVIDTDGYWVAESAFDHDLPYLSVRVSIGDGVQYLPEVAGWVGTKGNASPWTLIRRNLARPHRLPEFLQLGLAIRRSSRSLSQFFEHFFPEWETRPFPVADRQR